MIPELSEEEISTLVETLFADITKDPSMITGKYPKLDLIRHLQQNGYPYITQAKPVVDRLFLGHKTELIKLGYKPPLTETHRHLLR